MTYTGVIFTFSGQYHNIDTSTLQNLNKDSIYKHSVFVNTCEYQNLGHDHIMDQLWDNMKILFKEPILEGYYQTTFDVQWD